jgi:hypothetical protein
VQIGRRLHLLRQIHDSRPDSAEKSDRCEGTDSDRMRCDGIWIKFHAAEQIGIDRIDNARHYVPERIIAHFRNQPHGNAQLVQS